MYENSNNSRGKDSKSNIFMILWRDIMQTVLENTIAQNETDTQAGDDAEHVHELYIQEKLAEAEAYAARPDAKWYTWDEVRNFIKVKHGI
jgi:hypothetical protein